LKLAFRAAENDVMKGAAELLNRPSACKINNNITFRLFPDIFASRRPKQGPRKLKKTGKIG
jgi:hypothetical protein